MTLHIPIEDLKTEIRDFYINDKIVSLGIDYQPNSIMGWVKVEGEYEEVEVFNFNKVCKMDNRYSSYDLIKDETGITIKVLGDK